MLRPGIALLVIGAIFAFAVKAEPESFSIQTTGVIFMIAGTALILIDVFGKRRRRTTITQTSGRNAQGQTVRKVVREQSTDEE